MNFPGSLPISSIQPASGQDLALRPFQRVTAEVLQVTGTQAILSVEGFPVVAQLSSSEQAAALLSQRTAHFVVTQLANQKLVLKFVPGADTPASAPQIVVPTRDLASRLLEQYGLSANTQNLTLVRAALDQRLLVTPEVLDELSSVLEQLGTWGEQEAQLAAAIKAAGLPLSAGVLALMGGEHSQTGELMARLLTILRGMSADPRLPADLQQMIQTNLSMLEKTLVDWSGLPKKMADALRASAGTLGRSLENQLLEKLNSSGPFWSEDGLYSLVRLQQMARESGRADLANAIDRLLEEMRQSHLQNVRPDPVPGRGEWANLPIFLQGGQGKAEPAPLSARVFVSRRNTSGDGKIDPHDTHLVIQVELAPGRAVQVDLSLVGKQAQTVVTATTADLCQKAREEIPWLEADLADLGFVMKDSRVESGPLEAPGGIIVQRGRQSTLMGVDIEV